MWSRWPARVRRRSSQIAKDFGISEACLHRWLKIADIDDGVRPGVTTTEAAGDARVEEAQPDARAGERDPAPRGGVLRSGDAPKMRYPLVRDLAADGIPVAVTCRVLGFSKQAFYKWNRQPGHRSRLGRRASDQRRDRHPSRRPGVRLPVHRRRAPPSAGVKVGERRVWRLCSQEQLWSVFAKRRGLSRKAGPPVHDDLVDREFTAPATNQVWLTDITEHPTGEGKLYLCAIKDVCSNRIVGYSIDDRMTAPLAVSALRNAIALRSPGRHDRALRPRQPVPIACVRADAQATTASSGRWAGSARAATTPRWNRSSRCCRRTSSTGNAGPPATSSASRSSSGSNGPTTADAANAPSEDSHPSNMRS